MKAIFFSGMLYLLIVAVAAGAAPDAATKESPRPVMIDTTEGWWQKVTKNTVKILHTADGGQHWQDVTPPSLGTAARRLVTQQEDMFLPNLAALSPLDAARAWVAYGSSGTRSGTALAYTADGGAHWKQMPTAPVEGYRVVCTFLDEQRGFILAGPRQNRSTVYGTEDGGKRWYVLATLPVERATPAGMTFRSPLEGWVASSSFDEDGDPLDPPPPDKVPFYHTTDGGLTWQPQKFALPTAYQGVDVFVNTGEPVFIGADKQQGYLPVELIRKGARSAGTNPPSDAWFNYETEDGGKTWHPPTHDS